MEEDEYYYLKYSSQCGLCNLLISYSYSLCPDLMAVALEQKDLQLLQICLERFPDIPEEITYACLKAFLR